MKSILAGLALATVAALGLASKADAAPMSPVASPTLFHGGGYHGGHGGYRGGYGGYRGGYRSGWGVGVGFTTGGGYYAPAYVAPSGYWTTQYRWVPTTVCSGYDRFGQPMYTTQYVQQAYQVWVETPGYYAPSYGYARPSVTVGVGYRWR